MALAHHTAALFFLMMAAGSWMLLAGVHKHALEWRRRKRTCPSCGRHIDGRGCGCVERF
jgi:hypothetical protein